MSAKVNAIRKFNRFYTRILGLLNHQILDSAFSLTEARVLYEIGHVENCSAKTLIRLLDLDKSYLSRILKRFENLGFITRIKDENDNRMSYLHLTEEGRSTLLALNDSSNRQIERLTDKLSHKMQDELIRNMQSIEKILTGKATEGEVTIRDAKPGDLGYIVHRHGVLYAQEYGFDGEFENYVLQAIARFVEQNGVNDRIWVAESGGVFVGTIAVVETEPNTAQLRWFLTEPEFRNQGVGKKLLTHVSNYCHNRFSHVFLWTVSALEPARHLYQKYGFQLTETKTHCIWGQNLTEERWDLSL